jgi:hypothetical protein
VITNESVINVTYDISIGEATVEFGDVHGLVFLSQAFLWKCVPFLSGFVEFYVFYSQLLYGRSIEASYRGVIEYYRLEVCDRGVHELALDFEVDSGITRLLNFQLLRERAESCAPVQAILDQRYGLHQRFKSGVLVVELIHEISEPTNLVRLLCIREYLVECGEEGAEPDFFHFLQGRSPVCLLCELE